MGRAVYETLVCSRGTQFPIGLLCLGSIAPITSNWLQPRVGRHILDAEFVYGQLVGMQLV